MSQESSRSYTIIRTIPDAEDAAGKAAGWGCLIFALGGLAMWIAVAIKMIRWAFS